MLYLVARNLLASVAAVLAATTASAAAVLVTVELVGGGWVCAALLALLSAIISCNVQTYGCATTCRSSVELKEVKKTVPARAI